MKLYDRITDKEIAEYLNRHAFEKGGKVIKVTHQKLSTLWRDPFYMGIFVYNDTQVDLRQENPDFVPMITEDEYNTLIERLAPTDKAQVLARKRQNEDIYPLESGMLKTPDGYIFTPGIPNIGRYQTSAKKSGKELHQEVRPNQIVYRCQNPKSAYFKDSVRFNEIDILIAEELSHVRISKTHYDAYRKKVL